MKALCAPFTVLLLATVVTPAGAAPVCDPKNGGLTLPPGFCALVAADGLGTARHLAASADGDLYVALQGEDGGLVGLRDKDGNGSFEVVERFGQGNFTGIGLRNGYVYAATPNAVVRFRLTPGRLSPAGSPETVVSGLHGERQHGDKGLAFDGKGGLYVNVGAPSNACQVRDRQPQSPGQDPCRLLETTGGIWRFDENTLGQTPKDGVRFATGLRQMPAITWHGDALYVAMNNRDQLDAMWPGRFTAKENAERPAEPLYRATQGADFGWPYCFYDYGQKKLLLNPEYGGDGTQVGRCSQFTAPIAAYPAHWAPLALEFYTGSQFPAKYRGGAFIAFHGSWNRSPLPQDGYNVTFQPFAAGKPAGPFEVFASGFIGKPSIMNPGEAASRPDGVAQGPDGSLYVSDSENGRIWRVLYQGR
ncbi:MAG: sorbosone dehydrogenase family protein [Vicinamibacterales bacterium]